MYSTFCRHVHSHIYSGINSRPLSVTTVTLFIVYAYNLLSICLTAFNIISLKKGSA